jgi:hypothetical protein
MANRKPHKNTNHKQNIILLTIILRLRLQPSVPYVIIADFLLSTLPEIMPRFAKKVAPQKLQATILEKGMKEWLTGWLEEAFDRAEQLCTAEWIRARDWDEDAVWQVLRVTGLGERGFVAAGEEEMNSKYSCSNMDSCAFNVSHVL